MNNLTGKVAVVTGGSKGIGAAIAKALEGQPPRRLGANALDDSYVEETEVAA